ncbi:hypothetical protein TRFO_38798 [Tritrichomonas foetus]|uniref:Uncharacterized protein n=1 Tax=Tritrichomonas foetus TaxID=1144522 RepID=A0A1J4JBF1_9EUKA|nr:hypothetical protein TRFO_38798 [Tritrichomonas foetus]|eukprot:OHS94987.1 hypothetical protein TRFO_38798 [Tritrichomonas foetus]
MTCYMKFFITMNYPIVIRVALIIAFIVFAQYELYTSNDLSSVYFPLKAFDFLKNRKSENDMQKRLQEINPNDRFIDPMKYDRKLPLINRTIPKKDADWATNFLRLPIWSYGYNPCDSKSTEVSCFEVYRAAKAVERWENAVREKKTIGQIYVQISDNIQFADRISMLYHGLQIAITTNRDLITNINKFSVFKLPPIIRNATGHEIGHSLPTDHQFGCADVSQRYPNLQFNGATWPQVLYTHHEIAPKLRETFGFHSAYFLGNYLFGQIDRPRDRCVSSKSQVIVEAFSFDHQNAKDMVNASDYLPLLSRCGVRYGEASIALNDRTIRFKPMMYKEVNKFDANDDSQMLCTLRLLTSAKRTIHTFGSRLGFWATAMQGSPGSFVNGIDSICVNMTNSQQGSLWHTYCPVEKAGFLFRTNNRFFICGPNVEDARIYLDYLLW